jgi:hypothetical protein
MRCGTLCAALNGTKVGCTCRSMRASRGKFWNGLGRFMESVHTFGMTETQLLSEEDSWLLDELSYLRLHPFGGKNIVERLERTPTLSALAANLYGCASTISARDQHQRGLLMTASSNMPGSGGEALLHLLGLKRETAGKGREYRHDVAGRYVHPEPLGGKTFARRDYWRPFLVDAVVAIRQVFTSNLANEGDEPPALRDIVIPVVERGLTVGLAASLVDPVDSRHSTYVLYGPPGSGALTVADEAISRATTLSRHVIRTSRSDVYHRDLLNFLEVYGVDAASWSIAACELAFFSLLERSPTSLGGVIIRTNHSVEQVIHLIPPKHRAHVVVTARRRGPSRVWIDEFVVDRLEPEEAVEILASGHSSANRDDLLLLAELLFRHAGLLVAAARSSETVATLIRRLRRARLDTIRRLAYEVDTDLDAWARQVLDAVSSDPDVSLALDVALWITGFSHWNLYHLLGFLMPGRASPSRVQLALSRLDDAGIWNSQFSEVFLEVLASHRKDRLTPLVLQIASLEIPEKFWSAIKILSDAGEKPCVSLDGYETQISALTVIFGVYGLFLAFSDSAGIWHTQFWKGSDYLHGEGLFVLYEDGSLRVDNQMLDVEYDSLWPQVTRYFLEFITTSRYLTAVPGGRRVSISEGPAHRPILIAGTEEPKYELITVAPDSLNGNYSFEVVIPKVEEMDEEGWESSEDVDSEAGEIYE